MCVFIWLGAGGVVTGGRLLEKVHYGFLSFQVFSLDFGLFGTGTRRVCLGHDGLVGGRLGGHQGKGSTDPINGLITECH